jgi:hypothetical protein
MNYSNSNFAAGLVPGLFTRIDTRRTSMRARGQQGSVVASTLSSLVPRRRPLSPVAGCDNATDVGIASKPTAAVGVAPSPNGSSSSSSGSSSVCTGTFAISVGDQVCDRHAEMAWSTRDCACVSAGSVTPLQILNGINLKTGELAHTYWDEDGILGFEISTQGPTGTFAVVQVQNGYLKALDPTGQTFCPMMGTLSFGARIGLNAMLAEMPHGGTI